MGIQLDNPQQELKAQDLDDDDLRIIMDLLLRQLDLKIVVENIGSGIIYELVQK